MDTIKFFNCTFADLPLNMQEVYMLMGYGSNIPNNEVMLIIDEVLTELSKRIKPHYGYILLNGNTIGLSQLQLKDTLFNPGRIITHAMKNADFYAIFTVTIGEEFDQYCKLLKRKDDMLCVFITDAIGSVLAEATVSLLIKHLDQYATENNMHISNNYSPGYCDWVLSEQKKLFQFFPVNTTGISLTDSCLMLPVKSVSGIIAIGKNVKKHPYGCDICKMSTCIKNKKKHQLN